MIDFVPAQAWMANAIRLQPTQAFAGHKPTPEALAFAISRGSALACVRRGEIIALGGVMEHWPGRGELWGLLSGSIGADMLLMHRAVLRGLQLVKHERLEAVVFEGHDEGHRWMAMLGFVAEGDMQNYWNGLTFTRYARVRRG